MLGTYGIYSAFNFELTVGIADVTYEIRQINTQHRHKENWKTF